MNVLMNQKNEPMNAPFDQMNGLMDQMGEWVNVLMMVDEWCTRPHQRGDVGILGVTGKVGITGGGDGGGGDGGGGSGGGNSSRGGGGGGGGGGAVCTLVAAPTAAAGRAADGAPFVLFLRRRLGRGGLSPPDVVAVADVRLVRESLHPRPSVPTTTTTTST